MLSIAAPSTSITPRRRRWTRALALEGRAAGSGARRRGRAGGCGLGAGALEGGELAVEGADGVAGSPLGPVAQPGRDQNDGPHNGEDNQHHGQSSSTYLCDSGTVTRGSPAAVDAWGGPAVPFYYGAGGGLNPSAR